MRLSDWSSDVCSSDLEDDGVVILDHRDQQPLGVIGVRRDHRLHAADMRHDAFGRLAVRLTAEDASPKGGPHCHWADEVVRRAVAQPRSEEHTSELQSLMRISYAVFCLKKKKQKQ